MNEKMKTPKRQYIESVSCSIHVKSQDDCYDTITISPKTMCKITGIYYDKMSNNVQIYTKHRECA